jgi:beta-xylosidase
MKIIKFLPFVLILMFLSCNDSESKDVFMFSYFKNNGEDGLHLAYSMDGLKWKALNNDQSFLEPKLSKDKLMRDPCIIFGPDGKYHMVWTVSWGGNGIGYANSIDLKNWSEQKFIPVMQHEKGTRNSWAPELFYDDKEKQYLIFWASTISDKFNNTKNQTEDGYNHRMYYTTTKDFENFSETKLFVEPGFNVIDATITKNGNEYFMIIKDETLVPEAKKSLHILFSDNLYDWNVPFSHAISWSWVEGPTVTKIGDEWVIYFDQYRKGSFGALKSRDLVKWEDISDSISFPDGIRHGTVFKVLQNELLNLRKNYTN